MVFELSAALADVPVPEGFTLVGPDDAAELIELESAEELRLTGEVSHTLADLERDLAGPGTWHWMHRDAAGRPDLLAGLVNAPSHQHVIGFITAGETVDDALGREAVEFLLRGTRALDGVRPSHIPAYGNDERMQRWLLDAGGTLVRRFGRMDVALDGDLPPALPDGVTVRTMDGGEDDWRTAYDIVDTAFLDHFGHQAQTFEEFCEREKNWIEDTSLCWLAFADGEPAAALLAKIRPTDGYVGVLGTLKQFRGRGLGRLLLRTAFAEFVRRGQRRASLNVDLTNPTGAVALYESVGMSLALTDVSYEFPPA